LGEDINSLVVSVYAPPLFLQIPEGFPAASVIF
jgi:hypothetical protein